MKRLFSSLFAALTALPAFAAPDATAIAGRALPYIVEKGAAWIEDRQCVSCHQVPAQLWSLRSAARAGLSVDEARLAEWTDWSADWRHWNEPKPNESETSVAAGNVDTMTALLMGRDRDTKSPAPPWVATFTSHLIKHQSADGSWKAGGQRPLQKLPAREIAEITTLWTVLALTSAASETESGPALEKARAWLATQTTPGLSTEWHALRLLLADGTDPARRESLLRLQHPTGGWGWIATDPADALATGLALYALARDGLGYDDPAVLRGVLFLESTQRPDGSWPVPSTRAKDKGKVIATSTYWGTAWATIGLLEFRQAR